MKSFISIFNYSIGKNCSLRIFFLTSFFLFIIFVHAKSGSYISYIRELPNEDVSTSNEDVSTNSVHKKSEENTSHNQMLLNTSLIKEDLIEALRLIKLGVSLHEYPVDLDDKEKIPLTLPANRAALQFPTKSELCNPSLKGKFSNEDMYDFQWDIYAHVARVALQDSTIQQAMKNARKISDINSMVLYPKIQDEEVRYIFCCKECKENDESLSGAESQEETVINRKELYESNTNFISKFYSITPYNGQEKIIFSYKDRAHLVDVTGKEFFPGVNFGLLIEDRICPRYTNGNAYVTASAFSESGDFVTALDIGLIYVWDGKTGNLKHRLMQNNYYNYKYKNDTGKYSKKEIGDIDDIYSRAKIKLIELNRSGTRMVSAGYSGSAKLWNLEKGKIIAVLKQPEDERKRNNFFKKKREKDPDKDPHDREIRILNACFSSDGKYVITQSEEYARLWNADNGKILAAAIKHDDDCLAEFVQFNSDGSLIITSQRYSSFIRVWHMKDMLQSRSKINPYAELNLEKVNGNYEKINGSYKEINGNYDFNREMKEDFKFVRWSPVDPYCFFTLNKDLHVRIWQLNDSSEKNKGKDIQLKKILGKHYLQVKWGQFSGNGKYVMTFSPQGFIHIWDITGENMHAKRVSSVYNKNTHYCSILEYDRSYQRSTSTGVGPHLTFSGKHLVIPECDPDQDNYHRFFLSAPENLAVYETNVD